MENEQFPLHSKRMEAIDILFPYEKQLYSVSKVCLYLDITPHTLNNWYRFWRSDLPKPSWLNLPEPKKGRGRSRMFNKDDIRMLKHFKDHRPPGMMAEYHASECWGDRGKRALANKGKTKDDVKTHLKTKQQFEEEN